MINLRHAAGSLLVVGLEGKEFGGLERVVEAGQAAGSSLPAKHRRPAPDAGAAERGNNLVLRAQPALR